MTDLAQLREQATKKSPDGAIVHFPAPIVLMLLDRLAAKDTMIEGYRDNIEGYAKANAGLGESLADRDAQIAVLTAALYDGVSCHPSAHQNDGLITRRLAGNLGVEERISLLSLLTMRAALTPDVTEVAARYREALAVAERVRKAITAHTTIATRAPDSPSAHYILPNLKAALREQDDVGGPQ